MERHDEEKMLGAADRTGNMFRSILVITLEWFKFGYMVPPPQICSSLLFPSGHCRPNLQFDVYAREKRNEKAATEGFLGHVRTRDWKKK